MQERIGLLDSKKAAGYLGIQETTLAHWRSKGMGPRYVKLERGRVRYRLADLDEWIEENLVTPEGVRGDAA